jgi:hypothetical protein
MRKHYSLIDKVYRPENLHRAYQHVRSNRGAPGIDEATVEEFGHQLEERLEQIRLELKTGTYQPSPVRRVEIDKEDGSKRPLGIPTVRDRVVQEAVRRGLSLSLRRISTPRAMLTARDAPAKWQLPRRSNSSTATGYST